MIKKQITKDQNGSVDVWFLAFIVSLILFFVSAGSALWAFRGMQDYKNNVEPKINTAVIEAKQQTEKLKDNQFVEKEKQPLVTYKGPSAYGTLELNYPKTWSAYIDESGKSSTPLDGYLNPKFVPGLQSGNSIALRFQVIDTPYSEVVKSTESAVKSGKLLARPIAVSKVPSAVGLRLDGEVAPKKQGALVLLPIRDKTLKIWTEASQFVTDFDKLILTNLNFVP